jgi:hypothetical protein
MNWKPWQESTSIYDEPIEKTLEELRQHDPESDEYTKALAALERLTKLKNGKRSKFGVSPDTAAIVLGNLLGILIIVAYEQKHAMTSKGLNYIKPQNPKT